MIKYNSQSFTSQHNIPSTAKVTTSSLVSKYTDFWYTAHIKLLSLNQRVRTISHKSTNVVFVVKYIATTTVCSSEVVKWSEGTGEGWWARGQIVGFRTDLHGQTPLQHFCTTVPAC